MFTCPARLSQTTLPTQFSSQLYLGPSQWWPTLQTTCKSNSSLLRRSRAWHCWEKRVTALPWAPTAWEKAASTSKLRCFLLCYQCLSLESHQLWESALVALKTRTWKCRSGVFLEASGTLALAGSFPTLRALRRGWMKATVSLCFL